MVAVTSVAVTVEDQVSLVRVAQPVEMEGLVVAKYQDCQGVAMVGSQEVAMVDNQELAMVDYQDGQEVVCTGLTNCLTRSA